MRHSKSALFLMELIVAVMFFALASAICIQMFVQARIINDQSIQQEQAMRISCEIIERYKSNQIISEKLYFDENGKNINQNNHIYQATTKINQNTLTIHIYYENEKIYSTSYYHYTQRTLR